MPEDTPSFPASALVVTSWQRWMVCKPHTTKALEAVRVFAGTYRGAGPEPVPAINGNDGDSTLPKPVTPDEQARG